MYYSAEVYGERLKNHMGVYKNLGILIIWGLFLTYLLYIRVFQIKYMLPVIFCKQMGCCPVCFFQSIINSYNFCSIKPLKYDIDTSLCEETHFLQMCVYLYIYTYTSVYYKRAVTAQLGISIWIGRWEATSHPFDLCKLAHGLLGG